MVKVKNSKLLKLLFFLVDFLLILFIIKTCKITNFCFTIINLISPIFIGYVIAWILKPYLNKICNLYKISNTFGIIIIYLIIIVILSLFIYFLVPFIVNEGNNFIKGFTNVYNDLPYEYKSKININKLISYTINIKDIILNLFYSFFISFYFLRDNKKISKFISRYTNSALINEISNNLRLFVKGTLIDTIILFIMALISFKLINLPYIILLSLLVSITNIIPYIGPYIGGIPSVLIGLSLGINKGIITLVVVVLLQFIESSFIHPLIMSKSLNLHPISILIGLIIFGHFFGIIGMVISTPLVSIIKSLYCYYKPFKKVLQK